MWIPSTARAGIGIWVTTFFVFFGAKHWIDTRTFGPVEMPVSLSRGTISTGPFNINVHAFYSIDIFAPTDGDLNCDRIAVKTATIRSLDGLFVYHYTGPGSEIAENITTGTFLGGFEGKPGRYDLQIHVLSDTACLDRFDPSLRISASNYDIDKWNDRYKDLYLISCLLGVFGLILIIVGINERLRMRSEVEGNLNIFK